MQKMGDFKTSLALFEDVLNEKKNQAHFETHQHLPPLHHDSGPCMPI